MCKREENGVKYVVLRENIHQLGILYPAKLSRSKGDLLSQTKIEGICCQQTFLVRNVKKIFREKENNIDHKL